MPTTVVNELGRVGLVKDRKPVELPPNAWTDLLNVRCQDGSITPFKGHQVVDTLTVQPLDLARVTVDGIDYLFYMGETRVYCWQAGTNTEVTGTANISAFGTQELTEYGNVVIINTGREAPQYTDELTVNAGTITATRAVLPFDSTDETNVCTWVDSEMYAQMFRAYKNYLIALDVSECGTRYRQRIWWSHPAVAGTVPITWDVSKPEYDAGWYDLKDTPGFIVDGITLRDFFFVFLNDAIYSVSYAGTSYIGDVSSIFNIRLVTDNIGLFDRRCVCDIGGALFFISDQDIYLFDGTNFNSIANEKVKRHFFDNCSRSYSGRAFVIFNERYNEVWVCFPESGGVWPTKALVWNVRDNVWSLRDIDKAMSGISAPANDLAVSTETSWSGAPYTTWSSAGTDTWGDSGDDLTNTGEFLLLGNVSKKLLQYDYGTTEAGSALVCTAQRTHLDLGDKQDWHMLKRIRPYASGGDVQIRVGTHDNLTGAATWSARQTFDPDTEYKLDFRETGRLHAIEFYWPTGGDSEVSGYEIDFEPAGRR